MSQPQLAAEEVDLIEEINFQKILLGSVDGQATNAPELTGEIHNEIRSLEKRLRNLRRNNASNSSKSLFFAHPRFSGQGKLLSFLFMRLHKDHA